MDIVVGVVALAVAIAAVAMAIKIGPDGYR